MGTDTKTATEPVPFPLLQLSAAKGTGLTILGRHFIDDQGRVVQLRGANVGSASKVPNVASPLHEHATASYTGRPFPLHEAGEHWARLRSWGLNFVRINVTWDAVEHVGRGIYDEEYLAYLRSLLLSMKEYGILAYVAIHQDVWSRYCGGSGAPGWTLEAAGFKLSDDGEALAKSGAAFLDGIRGGRLAGERGLWPTGYQKLACATMNTLFWGGDTFAPSFKIERDGKQVGIQSYLQEAFLAMYSKLVDSVGDVDSVLGFELMNEPHPGYIGIASIDEWNYNTDLHLGQFPTPLQSFALGSGHPTKIAHYIRTFPHPTRISKRVLANPDGVSVWDPQGPARGTCPWETDGVWKWSTEKKRAVALQEDYFTKDRAGKKIEFYDHCFFPFVKKWQAVVESRAKGKCKMVEAVPNEYCPEWPEDAKPNDLVYAPHWYDLYSMFTKRFGNMTVNVQGLSRGKFVLRCIYFGISGVKSNYALQVRTLVREARKRLGEVPIVFGECGVPIDLNNEEAFRTGDWKWQEIMMDALISAMEESLVAFNLWAYNPGNRDDIGDDWNAENFSWFSEENKRRELAAVKDKSEADPDAGCRMLNVIVRPYAVATAGQPISTSYDVSSSRFTYRFRSPPLRVTPTESTTTPRLANVTELFLPARAYPPGLTKFHISSGGKLQADPDRERVWVWFDADDEESVRKGTPKVRRVDIWVEGKEKKGKGGDYEWRGFSLVCLAFMALVLAAFGVSEWARYLTGTPLFEVTHMK